MVNGLTVNLWQDSLQIPTNSYLELTNQNTLLNSNSKTDLYQSFDLKLVSLSKKLNFNFVLI